MTVSMLANCPAINVVRPVTGNRKQDSRSFATGPSVKNLPGRQI
jgi:hypothetical protein